MGLESKLARLQARVAARAGDDLPHTCVVERPTLVDDGHAGKSQTWEAEGDPLPCLALAGSGRTDVLGEIPQGHTVYTVHLVGAVNVESKWRLRVLASGGEPERAVKILNVYPLMGVKTEIVGLVKI